MPAYASCAKDIEEDGFGYHLHVILQKKNYNAFGSLSNKHPEILKKSFFTWSEELQEDSDKFFNYFRMFITYFHELVNLTRTNVKKVPHLLCDAATNLEC